MYKVAIVGCGRIGCSFDDDPKRKVIFTHAGAYSKVPRTKLQALVDLDQNKLNTYGRKFNVANLYTDYRKMLEIEKPDIVSICTLSDTHLEIAEECVRKGVRAVFCEKPIASNVDDARKLVKICRDNHVLLQINHRRRFCEFHQEVKKFLDRRDLGKIQQVSFYYMAGIANTGSHMFDLLSFFFGDVDYVQAFYSNNESLNENDPNLDGVVKFKSGLLCTVQAANVADFLLFETDIIGSKGRLKLTRTGLDFEYYEVGESTIYSEYKELYRTKFPHDVKITGELMVNSVNHLVECLDTHKDSVSSGEDGLKSLELINAFMESAKENGERVYLPLKEKMALKTR